jgi:8-oxo-dGTP pyrophosphatase MutT (NUDIX family)
MLEVNDKTVAPVRARPRISQATQRLDSQVAALPWRRKKSGIQILLITSRQTRRWVVPKGWPMDHLTDFNAAKREAFEEAGIEGRIKRKPIGSFIYDKVLSDGGSKRCRVAVFALEVEREIKRWPEAHQRKRKWFSAKEAAKRVAEPELKALLAAMI